MAIRFFICQCALSADGGFIQDPINEALTDVALSAPVVAMGCYAKANLTTHPWMVKVIRGNLAQAEWDAISALPGVKAIPPFRYDKPTSTIGASVKTKIYQAMDGLAIPRSVFDNAATMGEFMLRTMQFLDDGRKDFGSWENLIDEWA